MDGRRNEIRNPIKIGGGAFRSAVNQHQIHRPFHRRMMAKLKPSVTMAYLGVFVLLVAMVFVGYSQPQKESSSVANASSSDSVKQIDQASVDNVVATNVAAGVAQISNLPVSNAVANLAVSAQVKSELAQLLDNNSSTSKPQIINTSSTNRSVISYTTVDGDTLDSLSVKFNVTKDTIKWANKITGNSITVGTQLKILPVDGILYNVKSSDTIDSIATKYGVDRTRLVVFNDLDVSGLIPNTDIILPSGVLPEVERPDYVAPVTVYNSNWIRTAYGYSGGDVAVLNPLRNLNETVSAYIPHINSLRTSSSGNMMALGNCTWWAWERRLALGRPLPGAVLGNAGYWGYVLNRTFGYRVDSTPEAGAVFESSGHVGIVERLNYDSAGNVISFTTSEMNWNYVNYLVASRIIPASNFSSFNYIH